METEILTKIALTKNEGIVYLILLKFGTLKVSQILAKSNLNSGRIYDTLERLKEKGLISEAIINNIKHFTASPPYRLVDYIQRKKDDLENDEKAIKSLLPQLEKARASLIKEVKALTFTGFNGIKTAADEALESMKSGERILSMGITGNKDERLNDFWLKMNKKRIAKKIFTQGIFSDESAYLKEYKKMKYTQIKVLTAITPATVDIYGEDKVLILNYSEPLSCILIYDKSTAASFTQFFQQLWKIAK